MKTHEKDHVSVTHTFSTNSARKLVEQPVIPAMSIVRRV